METSERRGRIVLAIVCAFTFYTTGAGLAHGLMTYPGWAHVGADDWSAFRAATDAMLGPVFLLPFFGSIIPQAMLIRVRPAAVPAWAAWVMFVAHLYVIVVSLAYFVPHYQIPLAVHHDRAQIAALIRDDLILREVPGVGAVVLTAWYYFRALAVGPAPETRRS